MQSLAQSQFTKRRLTTTTTTIVVVRFPSFTTSISLSIAAELFAAAAEFALSTFGNLAGADPSQNLLL